MPAPTRISHRLVALAVMAVLGLAASRVAGEDIAQLEGQRLAVLGEIESSASSADPDLARLAALKARLLELTRRLDDAESNIAEGRVELPANSIHPDWDKVDERFFPRLDKRLDEIARKLQKDQPLRDLDTVFRGLLPDEGLNAASYENLGKGKHAMHFQRRFLEGDHPLREIFGYRKDQGDLFRRRVVAHEQAHGLMFDKEKLARDFLETDGGYYARQTDLDTAMWRMRSHLSGTSHEILKGKSADFRKRFEEASRGVERAQNSLNDEAAKAVKKHRDPEAYGKRILKYQDEIRDAVKKREYTRASEIQRRMADYAKTELLDKNRGLEKAQRDLRSSQRRLESLEEELARAALRDPKFQKLAREEAAKSRLPSRFPGDAHAASNEYEYWAVAVELWQYDREKFRSAYGPKEIAWFENNFDALERP